KKPLVKTFLAFLYSKGWKKEQKWGGYFLMIPPKEIKAEDAAFRFYLPCIEDSTSYDELAFHAVETFAELYEITLQELFDLLSKTLEDIQKEVDPQKIALKKALLAHSM
ncbi:MAG: hypothetical protein AAGJ18_28390, partial [Bacteroidota bacterium]